MKKKVTPVGILCCLVLLVLSMLTGCGSSGNSGPATYNISGVVSGAVLNGVTINLTGAATTSTTTDVSGTFIITGLANGAYTVTPVKANYTFTPSSSAVTISGANVTDTNFVATVVTSTFTASGTYTWNSTTSVLTMTWISSTFPCKGPSLNEADTIANVEITSTTMTWPASNMTWSRPSGTANDIVGTWTATDSVNSYTATFNTDGTISEVGNITPCSSSDTNPGGDTQYWSDGTYLVELWYDDDPETASAVTVTGNGITGSGAVNYDPSYGDWYMQVSFTTAPTMPLAYTFSITDTTTWTKTVTLSCFLTDLTTNLSPTGTVTIETPTFSWTGIGSSDATYQVELDDSSDNQIWQSDDISGTSIVYNGPALSLGATYYYLVIASSNSTCIDGRSFALGNFIYSPVGGTFTAGGVFTWDSTTSVIHINWISSSFTCNWPTIGPDSITDVTITPTTMTWPNSGMTWTRSSGTANDVVGTWTAIDSGNSYTVTFNANDAVSMVGTIASCS